MTLATSRYAAREKVLASGLAPVRTTVGAPRFALGYKLAGNVSMIAPSGLRSIEDRAEFEAVYRARLDDPARWCHRTIFAAWWLEQTGEEVAEL